MDTSKEYIKMCEEAKKIQEEWKPKEGDYLYIKPSRDKSLKYRHQEEITIVISDKFIIQLSHIWLPRQDQLQEMFTSCLNILLDDFYVFLSEDYYNKKGVYWYFDSMEQFWLVFIMKEKYNKTWDNKNEKWN